MNDSRSWLRSRHLAQSERGAVALAQLPSLAHDVRESILTEADELAGHSVGLAHAYFESAVLLASERPHSLAAWQACARRILGSDASGRAACQVFLRLDPLMLMSTSEAACTALANGASDLQVHSRRLACAFVETFGRLTCSGVPARGDVLEAWCAATDRCAHSGRWRGEFLASQLLESATLLAPVLEIASVPLWSELVVAIGSAGRAARCPDVPRDLVDLDGPDQIRALESCAVIARRSPTEAARCLEHLPHAMRVLPASSRENLCAALRAASACDGLGEAVEFVPSIVRAMPADALETAFESLASLATAFAAGVVPFLRTVDRAFEAGGTTGIAYWVEHGVEIATRNEEGARAHFRLETRTANKLLTEHTAAVAFDEIESVLERYLLMMARCPVALTNGPGIWLRPPLSPADHALARMPERVDLYPTSEENQLFYKLAAAHAAGRWQYGTYEFRLHRKPGPEDTEARELTLTEFLDEFPNPLLAAGLFTMLDGVRIDASLGREFAGLARDLDRLGRAYAANLTPGSADRTGEPLIEALFLMSVGRLTVDELPVPLRSFGATLLPVVGKLGDPGATVHDSARCLVALYDALTMGSIRPADDDGSALMDMGGATVLDLYEYLDGADAPPQGPSGVGGDSRPTTDAEVDSRADELRLELEQHDDQLMTPAGSPLTPDEIRELIERGVDLKITEAHGTDQEGLGLYITELLGKLPADTIDRLREMVGNAETAAVRAWLAEQRSERTYYYDEWDHRIGDYRHRWCALVEHEVDGDGGRYFHRVLSRSSSMIQELKREFFMMRPEQFRKVRGMEDGDELDMNALVDAHADRRTRKAPSERLYVAKRREERDVATLFLLDMSASTDEPIQADLPLDARDPTPRRVIDVTKETLVIMSTVLREIGDAYAIYGFSGHGRRNVEFYRVKTFREPLGPTVRGRLGGIEPKRSTRMGTALRHCAGKLAAVSARARHLILLSDGFPQDYDYGEDRRSNVYGLRDTMTALQELESQGFQTFCITVDPAGHDYLRDMCPPSRYAVIDEVEALPRELPRIYRTVTRY